MRIIWHILIIIVFEGCYNNTELQKHYKEYDKVVDIHARVQPIEMKDVFLSGSVIPYLVDNYFVVGDYRATDNLINLFDKNSFKYITSIATKGKGPTEITNLGYIAADEVHHKIYVNDNAKLQIFSYDLDSLLNYPQYKPHVKVNIRASLQPFEYKYLHDTLCLGVFWEPIGYNDYKPFIGKWNMLTNEVELMKYEHPNVKRKRVASDVSPKLGLYAEAHKNHDLITVGNLNGELKYNIYGPQWESKLSENEYYLSVKFCKNKIIATYLNNNGFVKEQNGKLKGQGANKFVVFDLEGNYLQTWETNYQIGRFIYDEENNRIIMTLWNSDVQFAYLDLDGLL